MNDLDPELTAAMAQAEAQVAHKGYRAKGATRRADGTIEVIVEHVTAREGLKLLTADGTYLGARGVSQAWREASAWLTTIQWDKMRGRERGRLTSWPLLIELGMVRMAGMYDPRPKELRDV